MSAYRPCDPRTRTDRRLRKSPVAWPKMGWGMTKFGLADTRGPRSIQENRKAKRAPVALKGKIFLPEHSIEDSCEILDFSAGGAGLKCSAFAAVGRKIVLYADCFGRFDGVVVQRNRTRLGIAFQISAARQKRTADKIAAYVVKRYDEPHAASQFLAHKGIAPASTVRWHGRL
jgi:hypothetical protein